MEETQAGAAADHFKPLQAETAALPQIDLLAAAQSLAASWPALLGGGEVHREKHLRLKRPPAGSRLQQERSCRDKLAASFH